MLYDHISFHTGHLPGLTDEAAARHIGHYYAWAVSQNLHSAAAAALPMFAALQNGSVSGADFVLQQLNGGIDSHCFNDLGNRFTQFYYADEEEGYGRFLEDYFAALDLASEAKFYARSETLQDQDTLSHTFQAAFAQWQSSLKTP